jgi:hypothetical protein
MITDRGGVLHVSGGSVMACDWSINLATPAMLRKPHNVHCIDRTFHISWGHGRGWVFKFVACHFIKICLFKVSLSLLNSRQCYIGLCVGLL